MDSLTQATLGAAIGEVCFGRKLGYKGAVIGAIVATIPDLDVILLPFYSDLERISIHRGYSHSILFSLAGAFLITYILSRIKWTSDTPIMRLWMFSWMALFTHMLLDAFTPYGTQLFLPLSDYRVSFDSINIVDPVYTFLLMIGLFFSLTYYRKSKNRIRATTIGIILSSVYLLGTLAVKKHVVQQFNSNLATEKIAYQKLLTVPVGFAGVNWYGVAKVDSGLYIGKYSNVQNDKIDFEFFPTNDHLLDGLDPWLINRMKWFAQDYYTVAQSEGKIRLYNMQCDMQGIRHFGEYKAPTAFYFEITPLPDGTYKLSSGMHKEE